MIFVYGDESMDETQQRVCAVATVVGTEEQWNDMEGSWVLRTAGIPFHAKDCDSDHGDYQNTPHSENKALYRDQTQMLALGGLSGFSVSIDLMAQRNIFPDSLELAYYKAFLEVMDMYRKCSRDLGTVAKFTFDMRLESEHNAGLLYGIARENDADWTPYLASEVSFAFAKDNPRIQVADLFARESMKALDNFIGPVKREPRKSWTALQATGRFPSVSYSVDWFTDLKRNYANLEKQVGFCKQDYHDWLKQRNRHHNVTNLFHFMDWIGKRDRQRNNS